MQQVTRDSKEKGGGMPQGSQGRASDKVELWLSCGTQLSEAMTGGGNPSQTCRETEAHLKNMISLRAKGDSTLWECIREE